jgi:hypothetical protein
MPTEDQPTTEPTTPATPPAVAQKTEPTPVENMIPQSRFDEVNKRMKAAEAELEKQRKAAEAATAADLARKQEFEKLYQAEQAKAASLEKQFQDLSATVKRDRIKAAVEAEARKAGFAEPGDAHLFVSLDTIEVDESGNAKGVEALVKELAKTKPYLLTARTPAPGNGARPPAAGAHVKANEQMAAEALQKVRQIF